MQATSRAGRFIHFRSSHSLFLRVQVTQKMLLVRVLGEVGLLAQFTLVLHTHVPVHVMLVVRSRVESLAAQVTVVAVLSSVNLHVLPQVTGVRVALVAQVTFVLFFHVPLSPKRTVPLRWFFGRGFNLNKEKNKHC